MARRGEAAGEVPVGAVLVARDVIVARAHNSPIALHDPTSHAEMLVLREAARAAGNYRLEDATLYVTLEPCAMCAAAMLHARIRRLVFGAWDPRVGAAGSALNLVQLPGSNHRIDVFGGVLNEECGALLARFFVARR